jgi:hypothetical protein
MPAHSEWVLGLFLAGDRLGRAFARARVGVGALAMNRQAATMAEAAVATEIHQPLNVHRDFTTEIAFHREFTVDGFADLQDLAVGQLIDAAICRDFHALTDLLGELRANAVNILRFWVGMLTPAIRATRSLLTPI